VLNVSQNSPISAAQFGITQYASAVSISGLEMIQNSGKEAIIDLLDGRMNVAEAQLANRIGSDIYLDGTGNSGKNITGLNVGVTLHWNADVRILSDWLGTPEGDNKGQAKAAWTTKRENTWKGEAIVWTWI